MLPLFTHEKVDSELSFFVRVIIEKGLTENGWIGVQDGLKGAMAQGKGPDRKLLEQFIHEPLRS